MTRQQVEDYLIQINTPKLVAKALAEITTFKHVKPQQKLSRVGELVQESYLVLKGGFVLQYVHPDTGAEKTVNFHLNNCHACMTIFESFLNQKPSRFQLKSFTNSDVMVFPLKEVNVLKTKNLQFKEFFDWGIQMDLLNEINMKTMLITQTTQELYQYLLKEKPQIIQQVPAKYIAEFMGISREWLSRIKRKK